MMESEDKVHRTNQRLSFINDSLEDLALIKSVTGTIVTDALLAQLNIYVFISLCGTLGVSGVITNVINMTIFFRLGIKDSMSVCLFCLSFTDFLVSWVVIVTRALIVWERFYKGEGISPRAVTFAGPAFLANALFLCSGWILTFLSIERCVCVVFPFKVKQVFTKNRSVAAVVILYIFIALAFVPLYSSQHLEWINFEVKTDNDTVVKSRLVVVFSENRDQMEAIDSIVTSSVIPLPSLIIIFGSVSWMSYGLIVSSKLRHTMTLEKAESGGEKQGSKMTQKTRKLVKAVLVLAVIFLVCSVPRIIGKYLTILIPEININGAQKNLNILIWSFARLATAINASMNIPVYLTINSAYREKFKELIPCLPGRGGNS